VVFREKTGNADVTQKKFLFQYTTVNFIGKRVISQKFVKTQKKRKKDVRRRTSRQKKKLFFLKKLKMGMNIRHTIDR